MNLKSFYQKKLIRSFDKIVNRQCEKRGTAMQLGSFDNDVFVLIIAFLLISGVIAAKFSSRIGLPSLVLFILVGMLIGSDGLGWIYFDNAEIAQMAGILALIIILFEGGLQTNGRPFDLLPYLLSRLQLLVSFLHH